jgi:hypothetical protein
MIHIFFIILVIFLFFILLIVLELIITFIINFTLEVLCLGLAEGSLIE